jgi:hypothetical protein
MGLAVTNFYRMYWDQDDLLYQQDICPLFWILSSSTFLFVTCNQVNRVHLLERGCADLPLTLRLAQVGGVVINDGPSTRFDNQPYGGLKDSGIEREGVKYAIEHMTEPKIMLMRNLGRL